MSNTLRISSVDRVEDGQQYRGDLSFNTAIRYRRELNFWPWGRASGSLSVGTIEVDNRDGQYDSLVTLDLRNQSTTIYQPVADGTTVTMANVIIDTIEAPDDQVIRLTLKDSITKLDLPAQTEVYGEEADASIQGRTLPILLGVARNIAPTMYAAFPSGTGPAFRVHDTTLSGIGVVRDKGIPLDVTSSPPQWDFDLNIGAAGFYLESDPVGVITCDASSSGDLIDPVAAATDVLGGEGQFNTSWSGVSGDDSGINPANLPGDWIYRTPRPTVGTISSSFNPFNGGARLVSSSTQTETETYVAINTANLEAGKTYRWFLTLTEAVAGYQTTGGVVANQAEFTFGYMSNVENIATRTSILSIQTLSAGNSTGTFSGTVTIPAGADRHVFCRIVSNGPYGSSVAFDGIRFVEVPGPVSEALEGITLADYVREIISRAGLPLSLIDGTSSGTSSGSSGGSGSSSSSGCSSGDSGLCDLEAIDPNAADIGYYADSPITALSMMRAPLDSYTADVYTDRTGGIRFAQLRDVSSEVPVKTIDQNNLTSAPRVRLDDAPGLTTTATARRNWYQYNDSDFADNFSSLPLDTRQAFKAPAQFTRNATVPDDWPGLYSHAIDAEPLSTLYDNASDAATEIQRIVDLYSTPNVFIDCEVYADSGEFFELDEVALFKYPRYGFDFGQNMLIVAVEDVVSSDTRNRITRLTLWGKPA